MLCAERNQSLEQKYNESVSKKDRKREFKKKGFVSSIGVSLRIFRAVIYEAFLKDNIKEIFL